MYFSSVVHTAEAGVANSHTDGHCLSCLTLIRDGVLVIRGDALESLRSLVFFCSWIPLISYFRIFNDNLTAPEL